MEAGLDSLLDASLLASGSLLVIPGVPRLLDT